jgi:hypothetical protein
MKVVEPQYLRLVQFYLQAKSVLPFFKEVEKPSGIIPLLKGADLGCLKTPFWGQIFFPGFGPKEYRS